VLFDVLLLVACFAIGLGPATATATAIDSMILPYEYNTITVLDSTHSAPMNANQTPKRKKIHFLAPKKKETEKRQTKNLGINRSAGILIFVRPCQDMIRIVITGIFNCIDY
jgi:hypothetical protein